MRIMELLNIMAKDTISSPEKSQQLRQELMEHFETKQFQRCKTMGEMVKQILRFTLKPYLSRIQRNLGKITD